MKKYIFENPVIEFLNLVGKLIILNFFWMICCLPVVTIGAATSAMYSVMLKIVDESESSLSKSYFSAFKKNFAQSTLLWIVVLIFGLICGLDLYYGMGGAKLVNKVFIFIAIPGLLITLNVLTLIFPLQARYKNTVKNHLKNSLLIAFTSPLRMIGIWLVWTIPILLTFFSYNFFRYLGFLWFVCGFSIVFYFSSQIILSIFRKVATEEKEKVASQEENKEE